MATAPTPAKPTTAEDSVALENMFDDLDGDGGAQVKEDVQKAALGAKKPGNWDSEASPSTCRQTPPLPYTSPTC